MLPELLNKIIAINGAPEERFERTDVITNKGRRTEPTYLKLAFGWFQPIYWRTAADCVYGNPIGCIDSILLNRLEANIDFLTRVLDERNIYHHVTAITDTVWERKRYVAYDDLSRISTDITNLRISGYIESNTPIAPLISSGGFPNYRQINDWEKCLYDIRLLVRGADENLNRPLGTFSLSSTAGPQFIRR